MILKIGLICWLAPKRVIKRKGEKQSSLHKLRKIVSGFFNIYLTRVVGHLIFFAHPIK